MNHARSFTSRLLFSWATPFILRNAQTPLEQEDLLEIPGTDPATSDSDALVALFSRFGLGQPVALVRAILHLYRADLAKLLALSMIVITSTCLGPLVLREFISSLQGHNQVSGFSIATIASMLGIRDGVGYPLLCSALAFICSITQITTIHHIFFVQVTMGIRLKLALSRVLYQKALRLHREERATISTGRIINLVNTDALKVACCAQFIHGVWCYPIISLIVMALLLQVVGPAAIGGVLVIVGVLCFSTIMSGKQANIRRSMSQVADERVGFISQVLQHIKAVKFQAWEGRIIDRVSTLRNQEVSLAKRLMNLVSLASFTTASGSAVAMLVTFAIATYQGNELDAATVFATLALLASLRASLSHLPETIFFVVEAWVGICRIHEFLRRKDRPRESTTHGPTGRITFADAHFDWSSGVPAISTGQFTIEPGELVAVVGSVGSGKSALLLGILGELTPARGSSSVSGSIAYVGQQPWILSDSIRNNILCGAVFNENNYQRALSASALNLDLESFPAGDMTEIGERGINLSGGQRQRVALARALYRNSDIYLFDDSLSALDPSVANVVFDKLITEELSTRTRILVTHRLEFALRASRILVLHEGQIVEEGRPDALRRSGGRFSQLLAFHAHTVGESKVRGTSLEAAARSEHEFVHASGEQQPAAQIIVEEERERGIVNFEVVKAYVKRFITGQAALLLLGIFILRYATMATTDLWIANFTRMPAVSGAAFFTIYVTLVLLACGLNYWRTVMVLDRGLEAGVSSHAALLNGVLSAPLRFFESNPVGRVLNRFSRDVDVIENNLPRALLDGFLCLFDILTLIVLMAVLQPITLLVVSPLSFVYHRLQRLFRPTSREAQRLESLTRSPILALLSESLAGVDTIRSSNLTADFDRRFCSYLNRHGAAGFSITVANRWLGLRLELSGALIILACGIGASLTSSTSGTTIAMGLLLTYALSITGALNWFIRCVCLAESFLTSFERIERYSQVSSERLDGLSPPAAWPTRGELKFINVTLRYRPHLRPAIRELSCHLLGGERIGIIGRSGSGKSTLVLGLLRLLDVSSGRIELDGIDLSTLSLDSVRRAITVVPQEPVLFSGTLRGNIDPFDVHSEQEIHEAIRRVELDTFVTSLPEGLNAEVQESGNNFSSGQRQLLCLARALLEKSRVIVLDEATAHMDVETDYAIQRALRREFRHATLLVIAHRLGTVLDSDHIMVLQDGELKEYAPPHELLGRTSSLLTSMVQEACSQPRVREEL